MLERIMKEISEIQAKQSTNYKVLLRAAEVLKSFDGKKCSKRMETAFKKLYPDYTVYSGNRYSYYEMRIWGNGIGYQDSIDLVVSYDENFDYEKFINNNQRYFLEAERYAKLEELKNNSNEIQDLIYQYESIENQIKIFKKNPLLSIYPISSFFKI